MTDAFILPARDGLKKSPCGSFSPSAPTTRGKFPGGQLLSIPSGPWFQPSHSIKQVMKTSCQEDEKQVYELPFNAKILGFSDTSWGTALGVASLNEVVKEDHRT